MAKERTPKTPEVIDEMIATYDNDEKAKRPRKNEFTLMEIAQYVKAKKDEAWFKELYSAKIQTIGGKELPLSKSAVDEIRAVFRDKYFPKKAKEPKEPKKTKKEQEAEDIKALLNIK